MGVPLGGIGCGTICRGWRGDFVRFVQLKVVINCFRWTIAPAAIPTIKVVDADQFSISIKDLNGPEIEQRKSTVLHAPAKETSRKAKVQKHWNFGGVKVLLDFHVH